MSATVASTENQRSIYQCRSILAGRRDGPLRRGRPRHWQRHDHDLWDGAFVSVSVDDLTGIEFSVGRAT
jgi:hypothetical protein